MAGQRDSFVSSMTTASPSAWGQPGQGASALDVLASLGDEDWMLEATCLDADPEAFFPEKGGSTREAKRICAVCPVKTECLEFALENDERFGIWGGLSERERRRVKRIAV